MHLAGLIKIGQLEHLQELMKKGLVYANTVEYFRSIELNYEKHDAAQGASVYQSDYNTKAFLFEKSNGERIKVDVEEVKLITHEETVKWTRLFCVYYFIVDQIQNTQIFDPKIQELGNYALIITDCKQFFERMEKATARFKLTRKAVLYYDKSTSYKNLTIFHKSDFYKHQNEYRFHFNTSENKPINN